MGIKTMYNLCGEQGAKGENGITPHIGENGNWFVGDTDTGVQAQGKRGIQGFKGEQGLQGDKGESVISANFTDNISAEIFETCKLFNQTIQLNSNMITANGNYRVGDILYMVATVTGKNNKQFIMLRVGKLKTEQSTLETFYTIGVIESN